MDRSGKENVQQRRTENIPLLTSTFLWRQERNTFFCPYGRPKGDYEENTITLKSNEYEETQKENMGKKGLPGEKIKR